MAEEKKRYSQKELDDIFKQLEETPAEELVKREREKSRHSKKEEEKKEDKTYIVPD